MDYREGRKPVCAPRAPACRNRPTGRFFHVYSIDCEPVGACAPGSLPALRKAAVSRLGRAVAYARHALRVGGRPLRRAKPEDCEAVRLRL